MKFMTRFLLGGALVVAGLIFLANLTTSFAGQDKLAKDQDAFQSATANNSRSCGSPVGPPHFVIICHKLLFHKTMCVRIPEWAVPVFLRHGDTLGPCPGGCGRITDDHGDGHDCGGWNDDDHGDGKGGGNDHGPGKGH